MRRRATAALDSNRYPSVWIVYDPVLSEYMASAPPMGWGAVRLREFAHEFQSARAAEDALKLHWSHRSSAFVHKTTPAYTVSNGEAKTRTET